MEDKELSELIAVSAYIVELTLVDTLEPEVADFEGGDCWLFDRYIVRLEQQICPEEPAPSWQSKELTMPGRKKGQQLQSLGIGQRVIAFYSYSAMARGYALEKWIEWNEEIAARLIAQPDKAKREI